VHSLFDQRSLGIQDINQSKLGSSFVKGRPTDGISSRSMVGDAIRRQQRIPISNFPTLHIESAFRFYKSFTEMTKSFARRPKFWMDLQEA
jgi:hypothetical protein